MYVDLIIWKVNIKIFLTESRNKMFLFFPLKAMYMHMQYLQKEF